MKNRTFAILLTLVLALLAVSPASAHDDATYEDLLATYGNWTRADAEAAGYVVDQFCIDAASEGLPADVGGMGWHAVNPEYAGDGVAHATKPDAVLLDADGKVIGVEYEIPKVADPAPTVAGHPLVFTPPHPGMEFEHMSLHIYFVGDEEHRFGTWNSAAVCPAGSTPAAAMLPQTGAGQSTSGVLLGLALLISAAALIGSGLYVRRRMAGPLT